MTVNMTTTLAVSGEKLYSAKHSPFQQQSVWQTPEDFAPPTRQCRCICNPVLNTLLEAPKEEENPHCDDHTASEKGSELTK